MGEMQKEIAAKSYEGKAGGGLINIIMSGDGKMSKVNIDSKLITRK
jgi:DNA-binding protein YbaB